MCIAIIKRKTYDFFVKKPVNKYRNTREPGDIAKGRSHLKEEPHTAARSWKKRTLNMQTFHQHIWNNFYTLAKTLLLAQKKNESRAQINFFVFSPTKQRLKGWKHCLLQLPIVKWLFPLRGRLLPPSLTPPLLWCFVECYKSLWWIGLFVTRPRNMKLKLLKH